VVSDPPPRVISTAFFYFWYFAATQLALQGPITTGTHTGDCSNREAWKRLAESNGTVISAVDLGFDDDDCFCYFQQYFSTLD